MPPMSARPTTPPAMPPAIAAVFDELDLEEAGETVAVACATEVETEPGPIAEPASTSGESKMNDTGWLRCKQQGEEGSIVTTNSECRGGIPEAQGL
jgi:hypothetical protein